MVLFIISLLALIYSLTLQSYRAIKKPLTPGYKKSPEYQDFENQLNKILAEHKVNNVSNGIF
jgi:poly-D-alanine transfer protein DltD